MNDAETKENPLDADTEEETQTDETNVEAKAENFADAETELSIIDPDEFEFTIRDRRTKKAITIVLRPLTIKDIKRTATEVVKVINVMVENAEVFKALETKDPTAFLSPQTIGILTPVMDSITAVVAEIIGVETAWLDENLTIKDLSYIAIVFVKQNNLELIIRNFTELARTATKNLPSRSDGSSLGES
jgi:hypothetical protein